MANIISKNPRDYIHPKIDLTGVDWNDENTFYNYYNIFGIEISDKGNRIDYSTFTSQFLKIVKIIVCESDMNLYIYNRRKGIYEEKNDYNLSSVFRFILNQGEIDLFKKYMLTEFETHLKSHVNVQIERFNTDEFLTFNNQSYDLNNFEAVPFSYKHYNTSEMGYDCDPQNNTHPVFDKFLDDFTCSNNDLKVLLQEIMGYLFWYNNDAQRSFIFCGPARSGKSTLAKLCTYLLGGEGKDNVIATPLSKLSSDFGLEGIEAAKAFIVTETEKGEKVQTSTYKAIISGDAVSLNEKYRKRTTVVPHCKVLTFTNHLPDFSEKDPSLERRILIFPCNADVNKLKIDVNLLDKLKQEAPAIFNWAMEGLQRLKKSNWQFTETEEVKKLTEEYVTESDPLYGFINEMIKVDEKPKFVRNQEFSSAYVLWAKNKSYPTTIKDFGKEFHSHLVSLKFDVTKSRQKGYDGLIGVSIKKDQ